MKYCQIFILFYVFLFVNGYAMANDTVFSNDTAELSFSMATGEKVKIEIKTISYSSMIPYKKGFRWGTLSNMPKKLISDLSVKVDGEEGYIPFSAYCDLTNPKRLSVQTMNREFTLTIMGGDAAGSYTAELFFIKNVIKRKKVSHNEFPSVAWEETVYSFNF
jgi:hypothetical protein